MDYKKVIESRYNREAWQLLLHDIFHNKVSFWNRPSEVRVSSRLAKQAFNLGKISLSDGESIAVYEVELNDNVDIERNRRGIRDMLTTDWRNMGYAGAFMFCYRKNESVLRFSYVSESWSFAEDGTYKKDSTDTKRFTYLLGERHRSRTAIQQFEGLKKSGLTLKDLTKAFSVDAVSDMFFHDYKQQYEDIIAFITGKRMVKVANKWEERVVGEPNEKIFSEFMKFSNPEKAIRDYVKKLMGRIVFLQFLQKKGWLGVPMKAKWGEGDKEFIQNLFINSKDKDHFIDNVLEYLFNDINTERAGDLVSPEVGKDIRVPYLNGGLFEPDAADATEFPLPAQYMKSMLDFFSSYNFTIDENDPDDAEMGVDPEMLGRIFENLLEDNKDKGAFYTPKEIVTYMCRESLIAYLQTDIEKEEQKEAIRQFVATHQFVQHLPGDTLEMLKNVKICDPAIGSGAFPMGLLKELFLCRGALEGFDQKKSAEIKKHIIQQNIYGVDIEKGAVDIARLRFWLSLIVDEETPEALPNLDFKIMQGNSLLEQYKGIDLSSMTEKKVTAGGSLTIFDSMLDVYRKELRDKLALYYNCPDHNEKRKLRKDIIDIVKKELYEQGIDVDFGNLDLSGNDQFFLWHTWFYDVFSRPSKEGFDIVIGNPPYVLVQSFNNPQLENLYKKNYNVASYKIDLYHLFIEAGYKVLNKNGILSFINPTTFLTNNYTQPLRDLLLNRTIILSIINIGDNVFDASVNTGIEIIKKGQEDDHVLNYYFAEYDNDKLILKRISSVLQTNYLKVEKHIIQPITSNESFTLSQKIESKGKILKEYASVNFGMQLRNRKIFTSDVLVSPSPKMLTPYHRKCLTGKDISDYVTFWNNRYCYFNEEARCGGCWIESLHNSKDKILVRQVGAVPICGIDTEGLAVLNSAFMIVCKSINPYGTLGILNSKLIKFYWQQKFEDKRKTFPKIKGTYLELLPIVPPTDEVVRLVKRILSLKQNNLSNNTSSIEHQIDLLVYHLYDLTYDEVLIVDPETTIIREEYEKNNK